MDQLGQIDLRAAMRCVANSVAVVTAASPDGPAGITATAVTSVSMDPPALLICVNRATRLHDAVTRSGGFRVNYLAAGQRDVANVFGSSRAHDKFESGEWDANATAGPRLCGAIADVACDLRHTIEHGTHSIFVGNVAEVSVHGGRPLLYCEGGYGSVAA